VDSEYLETFHIGMAEGRFFSRETPTDVTDAIVLNQTAVRAMGMTAPLGKPVTIGRRTFKVIGVIKDFHQSSLHRPIEPMILRSVGENNYQMCIRIRPENVPQTMAFLRTTAKRFVLRPDININFEFLDDRIDGFYAADRKIGAVLGLFTAIALFTACLGLLGLASFLAEKRTKEIGIRKILGAPVPGLILLQTREFSKWILAAGFVAGPAAYWAAGRWLQGFAYHISPSLGMFVMSVLATLVVAQLAVGYQSVRAARANPVEALRHE
jgi:putative ABC transport system permease protein